MWATLVKSAMLRQKIPRRDQEREGQMEENASWLLLQLPPFSLSSNSLTQCAKRGFQSSQVFNAPLKGHSLQSLSKEFYLGSENGRQKCSVRYSAKRWRLGCVIPHPSWVPLAAGSSSSNLLSEYFSVCFCCAAEHFTSSFLKHIKNSFDGLCTHSKVELLLDGSTVNGL